MSSPFFL